MSWSFRKSKNISSSTRLNFGKGSLGVSSGVKGARVNVNSNGMAGFSWSIPGTGIRGRKTIRIGRGGILSSMATCLISLCQITLLLTWWFLEITVWFFAFICWLMFQAVAVPVKAIVNSVRNKTENK